MKKISGIKIISVDLFRTLVDISPTPEYIWRLFLTDNYSDVVSREHWSRADNILSTIWDDAGGGKGSFKSVRTVLEETCAQLFDEIQLVHDPRLAADALMQKHTLDNLFPDAIPFLDAVRQKEKYKICLSTDCDAEMLLSADTLPTFDHVFVSEELRLYKLNPAFFRRVLDHYGVQPENILHIGDAKADIVGPKQLGLQTCWLNRKSHKWDNDVAPDFEVKTLLDIIDVLD